MGGRNGSGQVCGSGDPGPPAFARHALEVFRFAALAGLPLITFDLGFEANCAGVCGNSGPQLSFDAASAIGVCGRHVSWRAMPIPNVVMVQMMPLEEVT